MYNSKSIFYHCSVLDVIVQDSFRHFFGQFENLPLLSDKKPPLAIRLIILRIWVVLKTSVASMTSTDMIISLASMTSIPSLASKNQKQPALYILSDFPGIRNPSGLRDLNSLNNLSGLNGLFSLISSKQLLILMFPSTLTPKWHILVS